MKNYKRILLILLNIAVICGIVGCGNVKESDYAIELETVFDGKTVDLCAPAVREYLNATDEKEQLQI